MLFSRVRIASVAIHMPEHVVTSEQIETVDLHEVYHGLRLPVGRLELMTGIRERRFWTRGTKPSTVAAQAGKQALHMAHISPEQIGLLVHASVSRDFLEPATASVVHHHLRLPNECMAFDLSNACLGVLSAMMQAAVMIEHGIISAALIVSGETAEGLYHATLRRLITEIQQGQLTRTSFKSHFASLTIGSAATAVLLTSEALAPNGIRLRGGASLTDSSASTLCQEDTSKASTDGPLMSTDSEALLHAGCQLAHHTWMNAKQCLGWTNESVKHVFTHQVGVAHKRLLFETVGMDASKDFSTVEFLGNTGSAALPGAFALGLQQKQVQAGDQIALMGIGSGLSSWMIGCEA